MDDRGACGTSVYYNSRRQLFDGSAILSEPLSELYRLVGGGVEI